MEARQLIDRASYGPETLEVLFQAFDAAWKEIEAQFSYDGVAREAARLKLAEAVLSFAVESSRDPEPIKKAALNAMIDHPLPRIDKWPRGRPRVPS